MIPDTLPRITLADPPLCCCLTYQGDSDDCPIHKRRDDHYTAAHHSRYEREYRNQFERLLDEHLLDGRK